MNDSTPDGAQAAPMDFTFRQFVNGSLIAWGSYLALATVTHFSILLGYGLSAMLVFVPASIVGLLLGFVPTLLLGTALRRTRVLVIHHIAFLTLGAAVGFVTFSGWACLAYGANAWTMWVTDTSGLVLTLANVVSAAIAVWFGWLRASRSARAAIRVAKRAEAHAVRATE